MPFDNFYQESDKAARRWWKCFGLAFLLFVGYWALGFLVLPRSEEDKTITVPLDKFKHLWQVTEVCANLPKPLGLYFRGNTFSERDDTTTAVSFTYESNRSFEEVVPSYIVWFNSNGWKQVPDSKIYKFFSPDGQLTFSKNNQNVVISYSNPDLDKRNFYKGLFPPIYQIYCYQSEISFGIFD